MRRVSPDQRSAGPLPQDVPAGRARPSREGGRWLPWRNSIITIVLAGLAAFLGAHLGSRQTVPAPVPLSERVFDLLNENLDLTDQQRAAIRSIGARYTPTRERLREQSRALNVRLARLMAQEKGFGEQADATLEELQLVMGERLKLSLLYMLEVREELTPEQKAFFDRRVAEEAAMSR